MRRWAAGSALMAIELAATGCAKHYRAEGLVLRVDPLHRTVLISHRPIRGYMPAMSMQFRAAQHENLAALAPGTRIDFDLRVTAKSSEVRRIRARETRQDIPVAPPSNMVGLGGAIPDFSLTDQEGRAVRLADFRGRVVAIDFIYTRCPLPDVCPRLSATFAYAARRLHDRPVTFLSITVDPTWDTPAVLGEYARRYGAGGLAWRFLTGPPEAVREVAGLFGLTYFAEEGAITHTIATAVISRDGKLAARIDGSGYRPDQLVDLLQSQL
jgi:protein SCO1/2